MLGRNFARRAAARTLLGHPERLDALARGLSGQWSGPPCTRDPKPGSEAFRAGVQPLTNLPNPFMRSKHWPWVAAAVMLI